MIYSKLDSFKMPKDILFLVFSFAFEQENIIYDPEYFDHYKLVRQKYNIQDSCKNMNNQRFVDNRQALFAACESMTNQGFVNIFIKN